MGLFNHLFKPKDPQGQEKMGGNPDSSMEEVVSGPATPPPDPSAFLHPKAYVPRGGGVPVTPFVRPPSAAPAIPPPKKIHSAGVPAAADEIVLSLGDVLSRIPTQMLKGGVLDPKRELRFRICDLSSDIARGRAVVPLSRIAALCPDIFQKAVTPEEDIEVRLPLQKLVEQIGLMRSSKPAALMEKGSQAEENGTPRLPLPPAALSRNPTSAPLEKTSVELKPLQPSPLAPNAFELKPQTPGTTPAPTSTPVLTPAPAPTLPSTPLPIPVLPKPTAPNVFEETKVEPASPVVIAPEAEKAPEKAPQASESLPSLERTAKSALVELLRRKAAKPEPLTPGISLDAASVNETPLRLSAEASPAPLIATEEFSELPLFIAPRTEPLPLEPAPCETEAKSLDGSHLAKQAESSSQEAAAIPVEEKEVEIKVAESPAAAESETFNPKADPSRAPGPLEIETIAFEAPVVQESEAVAEAVISDHGIKEAVSAAGVDVSSILAKVVVKPPRPQAEPAPKFVENDAALTKPLVVSESEAVPALPIATESAQENAAIGSSYVKGYLPDIETPESESESSEDAWTDPFDGSLKEPSNPQPSRETIAKAALIGLRQLKTILSDAAPLDFKTEMPGEDEGSGDERSGNLSGHDPVAETAVHFAPSDPSTFGVIVPEETLDEKVSGTFKEKELREFEQLLKQPALLKAMREKAVEPSSGLNEAALARPAQEAEFPPASPRFGHAPEIRQSHVSIPPELALKLGIVLEPGESALKAPSGPGALSVPPQPLAAPNAASGGDIVVPLPVIVASSSETAEEPEADLEEADSDRTTAADRICLSLKEILKTCPREILVGEVPEVADDLEIELPFAPIDEQLTWGTVEVSSLRFIAALPPEYMRYFVVRENVKVPLPLEEILKNLPESILWQTKGSEEPTPVAPVAQNEPISKLAPASEFAPPVRDEKADAAAELSLPANLSRSAEGPLFSLAPGQIPLAEPPKLKSIPFVERLAAEAPKIEEPEASSPEAPTAEKRAVEAPKIEEPEATLLPVALTVEKRAVETAKIEAPVATSLLVAPTAEKRAVETAKIETPVASSPVVPTVEELEVEAAKVEALVALAWAVVPTVEQSVVEAAKAETPVAFSLPVVPTVEKPVVEAERVEASVAFSWPVVPPVEEAAVEAAKAEAPVAFSLPGVPTVEKPAVDAPKIEAPVATSLTVAQPVEQSVVESAKAETPVAFSLPGVPTVEKPVVEAERVEASVAFSWPVVPPVEEPAVEAAKAEAPVAFSLPGVPTVEKPAVDAPKIEAPVATSLTVAPPVEQSVAAKPETPVAFSLPGVPTVEKPVVEAAKVEAPVAFPWPVVPTVEGPAVEAAKSEAPVAFSLSAVPPVEKPPVETPKVEAPIATSLPVVLPVEELAVKAAKAEESVASSLPAVVESERINAEPRKTNSDFDPSLGYESVAETSQPSLDAEVSSMELEPPIPASFEDESGEIGLAELQREMQSGPEGAEGLVAPMEHDEASHAEEFVLNMPAFRVFVPPGPPVFVSAPEATDTPVATPGLQGESLGEESASGNKSANFSSEPRGEEFSGGSPIPVSGLAVPANDEPAEFAVPGIPKAEALEETGEFHSFSEYLRMQETAVQAIADTSGTNAAESSGAEPCADLSDEIPAPPVESPSEMEAAAELEIKAATTESVTPSEGGKQKFETLKDESLRTFPPLDRMRLIRPPPVIRPVIVAPPKIFASTPPVEIRVTQVSEGTLSGVELTPRPVAEISVPDAPDTLAPKGDESPETAPITESSTTAPPVKSSEWNSDPVLEPAKSPALPSRETKDEAPIKIAASAAMEAEEKGKIEVPPPPVVRKISLSVPKLPTFHVPPLPKSEAVTVSGENAPAPPPLPLGRFDQTLLQSVFMTEDILDLPAICRHVAALPGLQACVVARRGETLHAGELPPGFELSALLALSPGVNAAVGRLPIGALKHFTLYAEEHSVSFFERQGVCLCVVHRTRSFVPGVREKLVTVADELSKS